MERPYAGSLTREQFMFREMRIVAKLYRQGMPWEEIAACVKENNLFQYPTDGQITSKCRACIRRLMRIADKPFFVDALAEGMLSEARQAALVAMMLESRLFEEFMIDVIGEKYRRADMTLTKKDLNLFFMELCERDERVAAWSVGTMAKIRGVIRQCLRETGYIRGYRDETLLPVLISEEFAQALKAAGLSAYLPAFHEMG